MDIKSMIEKEGATIVDVREPGEYKAGHIEGSINLPMSNLKGQVDQYRAFSRPLILVCRSGSRSGMVTRFLRSSGMEEVYNGGAWDDIVFSKETQVV